MINANELRLGNFIKNTFSTDEYKIVERVEEFSIDTNDDMYLNVDHIDPIPITKEWLLRFGFEKDADQHRISYYTYGVDFIFDRIEYKDGKWILLTIELQCNENIQYIHQLQNLYFALTGNELNIKKP